MARPRSFDEDEVLRIARDQFWSTGYAATSVDDILAATGLGKGGSSPDSLCTIAETALSLLPLP